MPEIHKKTILLVEDEAISARLNKRILEKNGYNVIHAKTGEKALEIIKKTPEFDLILIDIDLGKGIDGTETAEKILKDHNLPLVFLSGHREPAVVEKTEGITSYGYVIKNSGDAVLIASIKMALKLYEANKKIHDNEAQQNALLANISDVIAVIDSDGINRYKSPNIEKWFGWKPEELIGKNSLDNVHPDYREVSEKLLKDLEGKPGVSGTIETRYRCRDGAYKWIEITIANLLHNNYIKGFLCNYRDISDRIEAKENLKTAEEKYRNLFMNSQVGIFRTEIETGLVLEANDRFAKLLGFKDREELFYEPVYIADWYADPEARTRMISLLKKRGEVINYEEKFKRNDGSDLWIRYSARIVSEKGWIEGVNEDITDFKRAEAEKNLIYKELLASEKKYRLIFDNSPLGLIYFNDKGVITDCNDAFVRIIGSSWSNLVGLNMLEFPDKGIVKEVEKVLNGFAGYYEGDYSSWTSGRIIPARVVLEPVIDSRGEFTGGVAIVEDITQKRIAERAILDELEKERARIGHVLHDSLGQKLGAVLYLAQAFEKKYKKTGELSDNELKQLVELTSSALDETRSLSRGLDLSVIEIEGFFASLNDIVLRISKVYGLDIELDVRDSLNNYDSQKLINLYYIILESINNAVRHGDAEKIRLLYYSNEGKGFFTVVSEQKNIYKVENPGMGLRIMKYRAEISGMEINIISDDKRVEVNISMGEIPEKL